MVERIRRAIDTAPEVRALGVTTSFGVATESPAASDVAGLIGRADSLMYATKRRERTTVVA